VSIVPLKLIKYKSRNQYASKILKTLPHLTVQRGILPQKDLDISWQAAK
jgi:hypothetical protein